MPDVLNKDIVLKDLDGTQLWPLAHRDSGGYIIEETYLKNYIMKDGVKYPIDPNSLMFLNTSSSNPVIQTLGGDDVNIVDSVEYGLSDSPTTEPTTWYTEIPSTIPEGSYLWTKTTYSNGAVSYSISYQGKDGAPGQSTYIRYIESTTDNIIKDRSTNTLTPPTVTFSFKIVDGNSDPAPYSGYYEIKSSQDGSAYTGNTSGTGTSTSAYRPDSADRFVRCYLYNNSTDRTLLDVKTVAILADGLNGAAGITIDHIEEYYTLTQDTTPVPEPESSEWDWVVGGGSEGLPAMTQTDKYLWNYEKIYYSNNTTYVSDPVIIGAYGDNGKGIKSITNYYLASSITNPELLPPPVSESSDPEWSTNFQQVSESAKYLWNYEEIVYTDATGDTIENTDPAIIGMFSKDGINGTDAYNAILSNENHTFPADDTGHAIAGSSTTGSVLGFEGTSQVATYVDTEHITGTPTGLSFQVSDNGTDHTTYTVTVANTLTTTNGTLSIPVILNHNEDNEVTFYLSFSYSLAKAGNDAEIYYIQTSANTITRSQDNVLSPNQITFSAFKQVGNNNPTAYQGKFYVESTTNFSTWTAFYSTTSNINEDHATVSLTGLTSSVLAIKCRFYTAGTVIVPSPSSSEVPLDSQTILFVKDGADAYNIRFRDENISFAGDDTKALAGQSFTTKLDAFRGVNRVRATINPNNSTIQVPAGMSITWNNTLPQADPAPSVTLTISGNMTTQTGTINIPVRVNNRDFTIPLYFNLILKGKNGLDVTSYSVIPNHNYILISTDGTILPSDSVTFYAYKLIGSNRDAFTCNFRIYVMNNGASTWTQVYPRSGQSAANESSHTYQISNIEITGIKAEIYSGNTKLDEESIPVLTRARDGNDGNDGEPGYSTAIIYLYQRAGDTPEKPIGDFTYTFSDGSLTPEEGADLNGWSLTIPGQDSAGDPLWVTVAMASSNGESDTIGEDEWQNPVIFSENGADGTPAYNNASVSLYRRSTTEPTVPSSTLTYNFTTGELTPASGYTGWSRYIPTGTDPVWVITANLSSLSSTDTITSQEWNGTGTAVRLARDGNDLSVSGVYYAESDQGTDPTLIPAVDWETSMPDVGPGNFLWTRIDYSDGSHSYSSTRQGVNGGDVTISSTSVKYSRSDSGTDTPSYWGDTPDTAKRKGQPGNYTYGPAEPGDYLWVRTIVNYSPSGSTTSYSISYIGENGNSAIIESVSKSSEGVTTIVMVDGEGNSSTITIDDGEDGTNGTDGKNGYMHIAWANSADGQTDFTTTNDPESPTYKGPYEYIGVYSDNTQADSQRYQDYSWSLIKGTDGLNQATITLYRRSSSNLTNSDRPSVVVTYNFETGALSPDGTTTAITTGWYRNIPEGTSPVWVTTASAISAETSTTITRTTGWSTPVKMVVNGVDGNSVAVVDLYKRAATKPEAGPTGILTYTFSSGRLTATNSSYFNGWSQDFPADDGNPCWLISAMANSNTGTDDIDTDDWAPRNQSDDSKVDPIKYVESGESVYFLAMDNDSHVFPATDSHAVEGSSTEINLVGYFGSTTKSVNNISVTSTTGASSSSTLSWTISGQKITVTAHSGLTTQSGTLTISAKVTGSSETFTKKFSWSLSLSGTDSTNYSLIVNPTAITRNVNPITSINSNSSLSSTSIVLNSYSQTGSSARTDYTGILKIEGGLPGNTWSTIAQNITNSNYTYNITNPYLSKQTITSGQTANNAVNGFNTITTVSLPVGYYRVTLNLPVKTSPNQYIQSCYVQVQVRGVTYSGNLINSATSSGQTSVNFKVSTAGSVAIGLWCTINGSQKITYNTSYIYGFITQYRITLYKSGDTNTILDQEIIPVIDFGANGANGADGYNSAALALYKRFAEGETVTGPTATRTYNFQTGALTINSGQTDDGWTPSPPAGSDPCYACYVMARSTSTSWSLSGGVWSAPRLFVQSGYNQATIYLYQRSTSDNVDGPSGSTTYTFSTGELDSIPTGWSRDIPTGTDPIWVTAVSVKSVEDTSTISSNQWASPVKMAQNGTNGRSVSQVKEYYYASTSSDSSTLPAQDSNSWKESISSLNPIFNETNKYLWNFEKTFYDDSTSGSPTTPAVIAVWSKDGRGISKIREFYQANASDSPPSTTGLPNTLGNWVEVPGTNSNPVPSTTSTNKYLWNCEVIEWTDGSTPTVNSPALIGLHTDDSISYSLVATPISIVRDSNNNTLDNNSITVTATKQIGSSNPVAYTSGIAVSYTVNNSSWTTITGTNNVYTIPSNVRSTVKRLKATLTVGSVIVDTQTIPVINSGVDGDAGGDAYTVWLSNENHTFSAGMDGKPLSGGNVTTTTPYAYKGGTQLTVTNLTYASAPTGISVAINSSTKVATITASTTTAITGGKVTFTVTADGKTFNLDFSYSVSKTGLTGAAGINTATVSLYKTSETMPTGTSGTASAIPGTNLTYNFANKSISEAGPWLGWSKTRPSTTPIWEIIATAASDQATDTIYGTSSNSEWSTPILISGKNGTNGTSQATLYVYKRAASVSTPSGGTYNFSSGSLTAPDGWSTVPVEKNPSNDWPCWVSSATVIGTGTVSVTGWTTPVIYISKEMSVVSSQPLWYMKNSLLGIELSGNTEQAGSSGKNKLLFRKTDVSYSVNGLTGSWSRANQTITVTGTNTVTTAYGLLNASPAGGAVFPNFAVGETYTFSTYNRPSTIYLQINYMSTSNREKALCGVNGTNTHTTFTVPSDYSYASVIFVGVASTATTVNATFTAQLEKGSTATAYEPHISPDTPQDIHSVSGDNKVVIASKNLLSNDWDNDWQNGYWDISTGKFVTSANWQAIKYYIPVQPNTTYYVYADPNISASIGNICQYDANKNFIVYKAGAKNTTFTTSANVYFLTLYVGNVYKGTNISLSKSDTTTDGTYVPFTTQSYPLYLPVKNLFDRTQVPSNLVSWTYYVPNFGDNAKAYPIYIGKGKTATFKSNIPTLPSGNGFYAINALSEGSTNTLNDTHERTISANNSGLVYVGMITNRQYYQEVIDGTYYIQVTVGNVSNVQDYSIELNKIGTYQDYIYKNGGKWYVHKETRRFSLAVADMNNSDTYPGWKNKPETQQMVLDYPDKNSKLSNSTSYFVNIKEQNDGININTLNGNNTIFISGFNRTQTEWKTNYPNLVVNAIYGLQTAENIEITDTNLIAQLNNLETAQSSSNKVTNIVQKNSDLPFDITYSEANTGWPPKPAGEVTTTSTAPDIWSLMPATYIEGYRYYNSYQTKLSDGSLYWSEVTPGTAIQNADGIYAGISNQAQVFNVNKNGVFDTDTPSEGITVWGIIGTEEVVPTNISVNYNGTNILNNATTDSIYARLNNNVVIITFKAGFPGGTNPISEGTINIEFVVGTKSFKFPYNFTLVYQRIFPVEIKPLYYLSNSATNVPPSPTLAADWPNIGAHTESGVWSSIVPDYIKPQISSSGVVSNAWYYWTCQYTKFNDDSIELSDIILDSELNNLNIKVTINESNISKNEEAISSKVESTTYNLRLYGSEDAPGEVPEWLATGIIRNVSNVIQTSNEISSYVGTIEEGSTLSSDIETKASSLIKQTADDITGKLNRLVQDPTTGEPVIIGGVIQMDLVPPTEENPNSYTRITLGNTNNDIKAEFTNAALNFKTTSGVNLAWVDAENQEFGTTKITIGQPGSGVARWRIQATGDNDTHLTFTRHS